jgi:phosphoribosyl 1,2-cyclic phosphodiesterase
VKVKFWGVRGSFAAPGKAFLRYGGNTPAVEISSNDGSRVLIDLGSGVTEFAKELMSGDFGKGGGEIPVLLTHTHIDHIQGLPFFTPFFIKGNQIRIMGQDAIKSPLAQVFQNQLNPHYSPLYGLENLAAGVEVLGIKPGSSMPVPGFEVSAASLRHGGINVLSFRITADKKTVVFMSDVEHLDGPTGPALELARGADLLIHDAMFDDAVYGQYRGWGHSSVSAAIKMAETAEVKQLALFHHNPDTTDAAIDVMVEKARQRTQIPLFAAAEPSIVSL